MSDLEKLAQQLALVEDAIPTEFEGSEESLGSMVATIVKERDALRAELEAQAPLTANCLRAQQHANEPETTYALTVLCRSLESKRNALRAENATLLAERDKLFDKLADAHRETAK